PSAHVFEGMRAALAGGGVDWSEVAWASGLNVVWLAGAAALFAWQFRAARERGALLTIGE
ncbi:MAG TPA: ABC transporter permease, partial [Acetobacteraceae bacterium]|nr:ABC transporter permease [Acetobacteraceae bacterium]